MVNNVYLWYTALIYDKQILTINKCYIKSLGATGAQSATNHPIFNICPEPGDLQETPSI